LDMGDALPMALSSFFCRRSGRGHGGTHMCEVYWSVSRLQRRLQSFFEALDFYSISAVQPVNYDKTKILLSVGAISLPIPLASLTCGGNTIGWVEEYKYLGYWISPKLGWSTLIYRQLQKIRHRTTLINQCKLSGTSSWKLRRVLFTVFVLSLFTWPLGLFSLFTEVQRENLRHQYFVCLKRIYHCIQWEDFMFSVLYQEHSLN
jgi:hypothetical protein